MNRRGLLKILGFSPVAVVANAASGALSAAGFNALGAKTVFDYTANARIGQAGSSIPQVGGTNHLSNTRLAYEAWKAISNKKLPDHKVDALRKYAQNVNQIDPDLLVLKSYSLTTKIRIQKERNFERLCKEAEYDLEKHFSSNDFTEKFGFEIW